MALFTELYELARSATLTLIVKADESNGRLTLCVLPKPLQDVGDGALMQPLSLTATPAEFDADFIEVLRSYREARHDLWQQAKTTQQVLQAAQATSRQKANTAAKPIPSAPSTPKPAVSAPQVEVVDESPFTPTGHGVTSDLFADD